MVEGVAPWDLWSESPKNFEQVALIGMRPRKTGPPPPPPLRPLSHREYKREGWVVPLAVAEHTRRRSSWQSKLADKISDSTGEMFGHKLSGDALVRTIETTMTTKTKLHAKEGKMKNLGKKKKRQKKKIQKQKKQKQT